MSADQLGHVGADPVKPVRRRIRPVTADAQAWQAERESLQADVEFWREKCKSAGMVGFFFGIAGGVMAGLALAGLL